MVIVANGRYAGGRIPLAPTARTGDGALDLVIIEASGWLRLAGLVPRVLRGRHLDAPGVRHVKATRLEISAHPPMWMNVDGETWRAGAASFHLIRDALRVIVP
jgi:diacylglycerol kinase family enzyme